MDRLVPLFDSWRAGLRVDLAGDQIRISGPRTAADQAKRLLAAKAVVLPYLAALAAWEAAVEAVATAYHASLGRYGGAPWLDQNGDLLGRVGEALRAGDDQAVTAAAGAWRGAWEELLHAFESGQARAPPADG
ncbi:MAG: hypothetical protein HY717_15910 [Planctomycetes bacterium]|nr:hypothetical protein [Planctomycetota bacterium]